MPALADRLFSWTVPIEGVEGGGEGAGIGMEVRIAVRWGDGGRMDAEVKRQFRHVVQAKCTCFLSLFTLRLLPRCLLSVVL